MTVEAASRSGLATSVASYWIPRHLLQSAWLEHGPFAFWIVDAARPSAVVELGTHNGFSFFAFCQAVRALGLQCACYAVDTWRGDEHAGFYGEEVFQSVSELRLQHYADIATLVRSTFDEALPYFAAASIDLLHIDGRHSYEDVLHDYTSWLPKLSEHAVVLFHDINVRERGFGVWKLWHELKDKFPSFEFIHGHGLGVLAVGKNYPVGLQPLFDANFSEDARSLVRATYSRLGKACTDSFCCSRDLHAMAQELRQANQANARLQEASQRAADIEKQLQRELAQKAQRMIQWRAATEWYAREKYALARELRQRQDTSQPDAHPLVLRVADWANAHPRYARWVWASVRAFRMVTRLQFGRLLRAARARRTR
jgi:hypothetical protein